MPRLVFSTAAREDLAEIEARIEEASGSSEAAQSFVELVIGKCDRLAASGQE
jgi:plasmid stabilization system protein ParE